MICGPFPTSRTVTRAFAAQHRVAICAPTPTTADQGPGCVVLSWLRNTEGVARAHYLMTLDTHFERAVQAPTEAQQNAQQMALEQRRMETHRATRHEKPPCFQGFSAQLVDPAGFEPATKEL
jgi:hypothetical protein